MKIYRIIGIDGGRNLVNLDLVIFVDFDYKADQLFLTTFSEAKWIRGIMAGFVKVYSFPHLLIWDEGFNHLELIQEAKASQN